MMRLFLVFIVLLISVCLGVQLSQDPGYVLIELNHWTIEMTFWVAMLALVFLVIFTHTMVFFCQKIAHIPSAWHAWRARRRIKRAQQDTREGLIAFGEGHWQEATQHLIKALPNADTPLLNYLTAARAAQEMGDNLLRDQYLREAEQSIPEAKMAVELTQAQWQLENQQWQPARATLNDLHAKAPKHPYILKLQMQLFEQMHDWPQLIDLLPTLKKHAILSDADFQRMQQHAYLQATRLLISREQSQDVTAFMRDLPKALTHDPEILAAYCSYLSTHHDDTQAELLLRRTLQKNPDARLIALYGQLNLRVDQRAAQLRFAESLLKTETHSAALYLCLARISTAMQLWGKAKTYLEESIHREKSPATYAEQGLLYEQLHEPENACAAYRHGLLCALKRTND